MATLALSVDLDFIASLLEVKVLLARFVREFDPVLRRGWRVHQLDNRGSSRHDIRATGQEIATTDSLKYARLAARLAADDNDLGHLHGEGHLGSVKNFL